MEGLELGGPSNQTRRYEDGRAMTGPRLTLRLKRGLVETGSNRRGIGLVGVAEEMAKSRRQLIVHSGIGLLRTGGTAAEAIRSSVCFPGTLVSASIPT
jgi:hypothetical protein